MSLFDLFRVTFQWHTFLTWFFILLNKHFWYHLPGFFARSRAMGSRLLNNLTGNRSNVQQQQQVPIMQTADPIVQQQMNVNVEDIMDEVEEQQSNIPDPPIVPPAPPLPPNKGRCSNHNPPSMMLSSPVISLKQLETDDSWIHQKVSLCFDSQFLVNTMNTSSQYLSVISSKHYLCDQPRLYSDQKT